MIRIQLIHNANQKSKAIILAKKSKELIPQILSGSKNKLKIKNPTRLFLKSTTVTEILQESDLEPFLDYPEWQMYVSTGSNYIGKISQATSVAEISYLHKNAFVESEAMKQLEQVSRLPGMIKCVGMPDLHAGATFPIGASFLVKDSVYPSLIGGDIGCGMTMYRLSVKSKQIIGREEWVADKIQSLDYPYPDIKSWMELNNVPSTEFDSAMGTVGRGNHFAEIQVVDKVWDEDIASEHQLFQEGVYLLVHSGSRGLGKSILEQSAQNVSGEELVSYLKVHDQACSWATSNRELIAKRLTDCLGIHLENKVLDIWHNNVERVNMEGQEYFLHRKGSAPTDKGLIAIPGSRGTLTFIVQGIGLQTENLWSVAHGAGRELSRTKALAKYSKLDPSKLVKNQYGGIVICEDSDLLCEEATGAYKNIDAVVQDLVDQGIIKVIATMKPMVTYKMRR